MRPYLKKKKSCTKIGLVEWLKVKALSSSPSTTKKQQKKK
jgi:ribosomal protein S21